MELYSFLRMHEVDRPNDASSLDNFHPRYDGNIIVLFEIRTKCSASREIAIERGGSTFGLLC